MQYKLLTAVIVVLTTFGVATSSFGEDGPVPGPLGVPGEITGTGTHFEITDSDYLNVTVESTEHVLAQIMSFPRVVILDLEAANGADSALITVSGLVADTTYYQLVDDGDDETAFQTDTNGVYWFSLDLATPHTIVIKETPSTKYVPTDTSIGTWDPVTRVFTLTTDVSETIRVEQSNLTLDGAGHTVYGGDWKKIGIWVGNMTGVHVRNVYADNCSIGFYLWGGGSHTVSDCTASGGNAGCFIRYSTSGNTITRNQFSSNRAVEVLGWRGADPVTITDNVGSGSVSIQGTAQASVRNNLIAGDIRLLRCAFGSDVTSNVISHGQISVYECDEASISDNQVTHASWNGISVSNSRDCVVQGNDVSMCNYGIWLSECTSSSVTDNHLSNCTNYPLVLRTWSTDNEIRGNHIERSLSGGGVYLAFGANRNTFTRNTFRGYFNIGQDASDNQVYNNNFLGTTAGIMRVGNSGNVFHLARPIGGNHWSSWTTPDADGNGIVDVPYVSNAVTDELPWTSPDGWLTVAPTWPDGSTVSVQEYGLEDLKIAWTPAEHRDGVATYQVYLDGALCATVPGTQTTYSLTGLSPDTAYAVKIEACDATGKCSTDGPSGSFRTWTPVEAASDLVDQVEQLLLDHGITNSLDAKLGAAEKALKDANAHNDVATINSLGAFINAVEAQAGKEITQADADVLIAAAREIIVVLEAGTGS